MCHTSHYPKWFWGLTSGVGLPFVTLKGNSKEAEKHILEEEPLKEDQEGPWYSYSHSVAFTHAIYSHRSGQFPMLCFCSVLGECWGTTPSPKKRRGSPSSLPELGPPSSCKPPWWLQGDWGARADWLTSGGNWRSWRQSRCAWNRPSGLARGEHYGNRPGKGWAGAM